MCSIRTTYRIGEGIANLGLLYDSEGAAQKAEPLLEMAWEYLKAAGLNSLFSRAVVFRYAAVERKLGHGKKAKELDKESQLLEAGSAENALSRYVVDASRYRQ